MNDSSLENEMSSGEKMACDDIFFSLVLILVGVYGANKNWLESDWAGFFGTLLLIMFGGLWLSIRIYHLTHKGEVFGREAAKDEP